MQKHGIKDSALMEINNTIELADQKLSELNINLIHSTHTDLEDNNLGNCS